MTNPRTPAPTGCQCASHTTGLSRRGLLKGLGVGALAAGAMTVAGPDVRYSFAAGGPTDTLLVLSLRGGFDGMSAVAPIGDPHYAGLRAGLALNANTAIRITQTFALHPALAPLKKYWDNGTFGVAVDVGQPHPTRSHFQAIKEMEKAAPDTSLRSGWIDRLAGLAPGTGPFTISQIGNLEAPQSFNGPNPEMTIATLDRFAFNRVSDIADLPAFATAVRAVQAGAPALVSTPVGSALDALAKVDEIRRATSSPYSPPAAYPRDSSGNPTELSLALADTARLIRSGAGLRIATIDYDDWDMHEWAGVHSGWMNDKLTELAGALAAFVTDLGPAFANTNIVTISDFGRRIDTNGTQGLDHGHGNQMLLLGGGIRGGVVHGAWPGLAPQAQDRGGLPGRNDYRAVIGSVLAHRMGVSGSGLSTVFPNRPSTLIDVAKPR